MTVELHILPDMIGTSEMLERFPQILAEPFEIEYVAKCGEAIVRFGEMDQYVELMLALIRQKHEADSSQSTDKQKATG